MNEPYKIITDGTVFSDAQTNGITLQHGDKSIRLVPSSPAPVNTQGLREALKPAASGPVLDLLKKAASILEDIADTDEHREFTHYLWTILQRAEQEQPAPAIGLSIKDALLQLREASGNVLVALSIDVALNPTKPDVPDSYRTSFNAFAHMPGKLENARGYTLPGALTELLAKLSPSGQPGATSIEETSALVAGIQ